MGRRGGGGGGGGRGAHAGHAARVGARGHHPPSGASWSHLPTARPPCYAGRRAAPAQVKLVTLTGSACLLACVLALPRRCASCAAPRPTWSTRRSWPCARSCVTAAPTRQVASWGASSGGSATASAPARCALPYFQPAPARAGCWEISCSGLPALPRPAGAGRCVRRDRAPRGAHRPAPRSGSARRSGAVGRAAPCGGGGRVVAALAPRGRHARGTW